MREDPDDSGLGEDQDTAVKNGDQADVELSDDDPSVVKRMKELIIKMTSHQASDRPSAEDVASVLKELHAQVNSSQTQDDLDSSFQLLQALNDERQAAIDECIAVPDVKDWINELVDTKRLNNPSVNVGFFQQVTCLTFASKNNSSCVVCQLVEAGCDVTGRDSGGRTPLHNACLSKVDAISKIEFLL